MQIQHNGLSWNVKRQSFGLLENCWKGNTSHLLETINAIEWSDEFPILLCSKPEKQSKSTDNYRRCQFEIRTYTQIFSLPFSLSNRTNNAMQFRGKKICEKNIKYIWYCTPREVFIGTLFIGFANTIENWF